MTLAPSEYTAIVTIAVDRSRPLGPDATEKWNATYQGKPPVSRVRVPSFDSCRALLALGITGRVGFIHAGTDRVAFWMDIEKGAGLTVEENDEGIRIRKYRPFHRDYLSPASEAAPVGTDAAQNDKIALHENNSKGGDE